MKIMQVKREKNKEKCRESKIMWDTNMCILEIPGERDRNGK